MKFKASKEQVKRMCALAVNASAPMGLGFLQFESKTYTDDDITDRHLQYGIDYFAGRMVKLYVRDLGNGEWSLPDDPPRRDYQSWCGAYPSYVSLAKAAGVETDLPAVDLDAEAR